MPADRGVGQLSAIPRMHTSGLTTAPRAPRSVTSGNGPRFGSSIRLSKHRQHRYLPDAGAGPTHRLQRTRRILTRPRRCRSVTRQAASRKLRQIHVLIATDTCRRPKRPFNDLCHRGAAGIRRLETLGPFGSPTAPEDGVDARPRSHSCGADAMRPDGVFAALNPRIVAAHEECDELRSTQLLAAATLSAPARAVEGKAPAEAVNHSAALL